MRLCQIATVILLLLSPKGMGQAEDARLSYQLQPNHMYSLDVQIRQNTSSESLNSADINLYSRMTLEFHVDSIDVYGHYHLKTGYRNVLLSMLAPGLGVDINSGTGRNRVLSELIRILESEDFRLVIKESGEIYSMDGLKEIFARLAVYPDADSSELSLIHRTLVEAYGPDAFQGLVNLFIAYFPVIQPIKNWTRDLTYYFNTKPVQMVNRYFLTRASEDILTIQGMGMLNSGEDYAETLPMGKVRSSVSGSQTYDYQVDRETGWLIRCVSRQRVVIRTTIVQSTQLPPGLEIPSYTETEFEVKGSVENLTL